MVAPPNNEKINFLAPPLPPLLSLYMPCQGIDECGGGQGIAFVFRHPGRAYTARDIQFKCYSIIIVASLES